MAATPSLGARRSLLLSVLAASVACGAALAAGQSTRPITRRIDPVGPVGLPAFGYAVAISADGSEAVVGGFGDDHQAGAAWAVRLRPGSGTATQQKLTGCISRKPAGTFGYSVALSGDGRTAVVGCVGANHRRGAVAVFSRTGTRWVREALLRPDDEAGPTGEFGYSVSVSYNGSVAVIGGPTDERASNTNSGRGAVWVFQRRLGVWQQDGSKLVGRGATSLGDLGASVAISGDGKTIVAGAPYTDDSRGAAWFFQRTHGGWRQKSGKLNGQSPNAGFGFSVSLSKNGHIAIIGAPGSHNLHGEAVTYHETSTGWAKLRSPFPAPGETGASRLGLAVAISADGSHALIAGPADKNDLGAAWLYVLKQGSWQPTHRLQGQRLSSGNWFGLSVALSASGDSAIIGEPGGHNQALQRGAVWLFTSLR